MAETLTCLTKRGLLQKFENRIAEIKSVNDPIPENTVFYISKIKNRVRFCRRKKTCFGMVNFGKN
ncbi:MAG: hypothetical protein PUE85_07500 [Firmicutes bacterium]|nr:hypothetical protein [Bacillota bacterium]